MDLGRKYQGVTANTRKTINTKKLFKVPQSATIFFFPLSKSSFTSVISFSIYPKPAVAAILIRKRAEIEIVSAKGDLKYKAQIYPIPSKKGTRNDHHSRTRPGNLRYNFDLANFKN